MSFFVLVARRNSANVKLSTYRLRSFVPDKEISKHYRAQLHSQLSRVKTWVYCPNSRAHPRRPLVERFLYPRCFQVYCPRHHLHPPPLVDSESFKGTRIFLSRIQFQLKKNRDNRSTRDDSEILWKRLEWDDYLNKRVFIDFCLYLRVWTGVVETRVSCPIINGRCVLATIDYESASHLFHFKSVDTFLRL